MGACCCLPSRIDDRDDDDGTSGTPLKDRGRQGRKAEQVKNQILEYPRNDPWNRDKYQGEMVKRGNHLIRNGRGLLTWRDGRCYEGTFQEDMAHGVGRFWILPEGVAGFQSCYDSLNAEGKTRVPTQDNPDRQEWNYGVRNYHGPQIKSEISYTAKDERKLSVFRLPYDPLNPRVLSSGPLGHREAGDGEYAWDYGMPIGSEVLATMGGEVLRFASHFMEGRPEPRFRGKDNFVVVKHDDGTLGTYCHLLLKGVKVKVHQRVEAGEVIGLSGNSGYTSGPHLHFHVAREVDPQMFIQIPGTFTGGDEKRFICDKVNVCYGIDGPISDIYDGEEAQGPEGPVREGYGKLHRADGALYEGQWKGGLMHGDGELKYGETDRLDEYCGHFQMGMRDGDGMLTWSDGRRYNGQWKENQINGEGTLEYTKNDLFQRCKYVGQFVNDMRHGQGRLDWGDGRWYEGPWQNDTVVQRQQLC